jgi:hypothetical protein|tara:strand:- start:1856 stop:2143 length:288 start_codon:yes stop_codon:yes gene_type:complete
MPELTKISNGEEIPLDAAEIKELEDFQKSWADGQAERDMIALRKERNARLAASDWTQSRDITLSNDDAWKSYRSQLRDFPENVDLNNIEWPKEPT